MSDESVETVGKPRGGALKYILFFVVGMLLVGAGFGGGYYMYALDQKSPADEIDLIIEQKLRESGQLPSGEPVRSRATQVQRKWRQGPTINT